MDFNAFLKLVSPAAISMNWKTAATVTDPYLGEVLFPRRQKAGLDLKWIKGNKGLPISLMPSAFDAQATYRDRIGVSAIETEMPFFREGFKIKEKDRQEILRAPLRRPQLTDLPFVFGKIRLPFFNHRQRHRIDNQHAGRMGKEP